MKEIQIFRKESKPNGTNSKSGGTKFQIKFRLSFTKASSSRLTGACTIGSRAGARALALIVFIDDATGLDEAQAFADGFRELRTKGVTVAPRQA